MSTALTTLSSPKGKPLTLIGDAKVSPNSVYPRVEPPRGDELGPVLEIR
ncbi:hypothetical protein ACFVAV_27490 [Nocardia sp. NPDC057663]